MSNLTLRALASIAVFGIVLTGCSGGEQESPAPEQGSGEPMESMNLDALEKQAEGMLDAGSEKVDEITEAAKQAGEDVIEAGSEMVDKAKETGGQMLDDAMSGSETDIDLEAQGEQLMKESEDKAAEAKSELDDALNRFNN